MTLEPLLAASWLIQVHVATVVPAAVLGLWLILASRKGSLLHRRAGYVYIALMTMTSVVAIWIYDSNPDGWSWIHLFIPMTLIGLASGLWAIQRGNVTGHRSAMLSVYAGGILIAGSFTFSPGRILHAVFFG